MAGTHQENSALVRRFLTNVVGGGDTDAVPLFLTDDMDHHNLVFGESQDRDGATALGWRVLAAADIDLEIAEVVATEDCVAVRAVVSGTHRESLMEFSPTGASFEIDYAWFCQIDDSGISEIHSLPDGLGLMRQIGALPKPASNHSLTASKRNQQP